MSRDRLADAYEEQAAIYTRLAEATAQIAHELRGVEPDARASVPSSVPAAPAAAVAGGSLPPATAPEVPLRPELEHGLGMCPDHGVSWTIKEAGKNAAGKSWDAFYKCAERDANSDTGWCKQKPQKIWRDTHPIREAA